MRADGSRTRGAIACHGGGVNGVHGRGAQTAAERGRRWPATSSSASADLARRDLRLAGLERAGREPTRGMIEGHAYCAPARAERNAISIPTTAGNRLRRRQHTRFPI
jgi:N-acetylglucosamine kinase-like BadF-type ATPase